MSILGFHINIGLLDGRVIGSTTAAHRILARTVLTVDSPFPLLVFRAADTHLHIVSSASRRRAGAWVGSLCTALRCRLGLPVRFAPPHFEPIVDQRHLYNSFRYALRQSERHGFRLDPTMEASNLPDLLGMRLVGQDTVARVAQLLPRIRPAELASLLGVRLPQLLQGPIATDAPHLLVDAAAAAVALPDLSGQGADAVAARRAAVALVDSSLPTARLAGLLEVTPRAVRRLRQRSADPRLVVAIGRQLRLRAALAGIS